MNAEKIMVVEDDLALSAGLCFELDMNDYLTVAAYTIKKARQLASEEKFDLIILDVNLPDGNGFDLCRELKEMYSRLPVIFLTANDLEDDVVAGFDMGADDYVTKPFSMKILLKRVEAALRHNGDQDHSSKERWEVQGGDMGSSLTENEGNVLTRQTLLDRLWDCEGNYIDDHTLTVTMNRLRAKIEDADHTYIKTVRGMGYIWTGGR